MIIICVLFSFFVKLSELNKVLAGPFIFCLHSNQSIVVYRLVECVSELVELLVAHTELEMSETLAEEAEELTTPPLLVRGCAVTAVERLDDEFIKLLKECDPHSNEYVDRYLVIIL